MFFRHCLPLILTALLAVPLQAREQVNPETGLSRWEAGRQGFSLEIIQVLPDYVRAVYASRGLPQTIIDRVSSYCVFGTILKNLSDSGLSYNTADWRFVTPDGRTHRVRTKTEWISEWQDMGVAFRWSLLPEQQDYAPGDWGQGFTTVLLPPETAFDLYYSWQQGDRTHEGIIRNMACAPATLAD